MHGVVQTFLGECRKELLEEYQMGVRLVLIGCVGTHRLCWHVCHQ